VLGIAEKKLQQQAGTEERPLNLQSTKMTSVLTGEKYKNGTQMDFIKINNVFLFFGMKPPMLLENKINIELLIFIFLPRNRSKG